MLRVPLDAIDPFYKMRTVLTMYYPDLWDTWANKRFSNFVKGLSREFGLKLPDNYPAAAAFADIAEAAMKERESTTCQD